jgi:hypothetical protein
MEAALQHRLQLNDSVLCQYQHIGTYFHFVNFSYGKTCTTSTSTTFWIQLGLC